MNRFNLSSACGTSNFERTVSTVVFAGILIVCSWAVGCSSEKPKTQSSINQPAITQPTPAGAAIPPSTQPMPAAPVSAKPVHKKVVRKVPATITYADEKSGVSFQYPRKYALKTGDDADKLVSSDAVPMDFVRPGGAAVAAVAISESAYPKSDLVSAFFNVSVNRALTMEQCREFSVPQGAAAQGNAPVQATPGMSKLMIGDMELESTETLAQHGTREEASKYYHVFENGRCYEFALKVATGVETDEGGKPVDREEVFKRLEKILATVKIFSTSGPEVTAGVPAAAPVTVAQ